MARKNISLYTPVLNVDASISFDTFNSPSNIAYLDNVSMVLSWTGSPVGVFKVFVSNDDVERTSSRTPTQWVELDFGGVINVNASHTEHLITLTSAPFAWIAFSYVATSGSGEITVKYASKQVGG